MRVPVPSLDAAAALVPPEIADALALAKARITKFHERQRHAELNYVDDDGTRYGLRHRALGSVAAYVRARSFRTPSAVLMTIVPAKIAGVSRTIVMTPPHPRTGIDPSILYACSLCGVDELYAIGGAHAIAAAAYGTETIAPVDKVVGAGSVWVTEAKRQVFGVCAIDNLSAAPEILVIADDGANSEYVVGELLSQAERDASARVAVVSDSRPLLDAVAQLLDTLDVKTLAHGETIAAVMERSCFLIHAQDRREILDVVAWFAPQHCSLMVRDAEPYLTEISHVGTVAVGDLTPIADAAHFSGINDVLPSAGAARFGSGLTLSDFVRTFTVVENSRERMRADASLLAALAEFEGLPEHAQTARMRDGA